MKKHIQYLVKIVTGNLEKFNIEKPANSINWKDKKGVLRISTKGTQC